MATHTASYTTAPPQYSNSTGGKYHDDSQATSPLLGQSEQQAGPSAAYDDVEEDFKYGTSVSECSPSIRMAFVRKVYSILFFQILATTIVAGGLSQSSDAVSWVRQHIWAFYVPLFGTLINLGFLYWQRHSPPWNFILLSTFTLLEAFTLGITVSFYDNLIVLQALLITLGVFTGLTLYTLQSKYDFDGLGPWLFGGIIALLSAGLVGLIFPFSKTVDLVYSIGGCLLFSGYIVYDTHMINKRLSPDEFIMGAISLYLDFLNLFINILRVLNNANRD